MHLQELQYACSLNACKSKEHRSALSVFGHVSGLGASLFLVKLLWQRRKLLNWLGIGLSETGSCNNAKVVKPLDIFKELSAAPQ